MDRFQSGAISGMAASGSAWLVDQLLSVLGMGESLSLLAGDLLTQDRLHEFVWWLVAIAAHLALGAGFGVLYAYIPADNTSRQWLRGVLFGGAVWYVSAFAAHLLHLPIETAETSALLALLIADVAYGLTLAYLAPWIGTKVLAEH